jgi:hypothetical protein
MDELLETTLALLVRHAGRIDPVDHERARHQLAVRALRHEEKPLRLLEDAALDWFALGRVRSAAERAEELAALDATAVRGAFERMLAGPPALAVAGQVPRGTRERLQRVLARAGLAAGL